MGTDPGGGITSCLQQYSPPLTQIGTQIYILRANLAVALIKRGKAVWFMQQDTFWRRNLFELDLEHDNNEYIEPKEPYDLLFDQIGHGKKSQRAGWVNGG